MDLIAQAGPVVKLVLFVLLAASVFCWAIILMKVKLLKGALQGNREFLDIFWASKTLEDIQSRVENMNHSPVAQTFISGYRELRKLSSSDRTSYGEPEVANVHRALNKAMTQQIGKLEQYLEWLATTASAAPFVGLFGTVWGIMTSFQHIGATGSASLAVVAPGISEALIATAVGLAAAIPAAIAYNHFVNRIKKVSIDLDVFTQDFLNMIQRSLLQPNKKEN